MPLPEYRAAGRTPAARITVDGVEMQWGRRFMGLGLHDARGFEADQLDITLSDTDGRLDLPKTGAVIEVSLGWAGSALVPKGSYTVDEIEHSGPPDVLTVRARSADVRASLKTQKTISRDKTTLGAIITEIAGAHQLKPAIGQGLAATAIAHIDQTNESDAHFLTRLGVEYDAMATIKNGHLLFLRAGEAATANGIALTPVAIRRSDGDRHRYNAADRKGKYSGVKAQWIDTEKAKVFDALAGEDGQCKTLRKTYPTRQEAQSAADSEFRRINRARATMDLTLAEARLTLTPETPVTLRGWKQAIEEMAWLASDVTHRLGSGGLVTEAQLEPGSGI